MRIAVRTIAGSVLALALVACFDDGVGLEEQLLGDYELVEFNRQRLPSPWYEGHITDGVISLEADNDVEFSMYYDDPFDAGWIDIVGTWMLEGETILLEGMELFHEDDGWVDVGEIELALEGDELSGTWDFVNEGGEHHPIELVFDRD